MIPIHLPLRSFDHLKGPFTDPCKASHMSAGNFGLPTKAGVLLRGTVDLVSRYKYLDDQLT